MQFEISPLAAQILKRLEQNGFEGYLVGGCVRDLLMGKPPHDWDITTNALPDEVKRCFSEYQIIETGIQHGTVTIVIEKELFEITTYRIDGNYLDGRHPEKVSFTRNLVDDLSRRDFTVNAMAYHPKKGIQDYFGGTTDLAHGIIRTVGVPDQRFQEDALRIMRGLRFSSRLNFSVENRTAESIFKNRFLLNQIAVERLSSELDQLLMGQNVEDVLNRYPEILGVLIPEVLPCTEWKEKNGDVITIWNQTAKAIGRSIPNRLVRLALLFHHLGKPFYFRFNQSAINRLEGYDVLSGEISRKRLQALKYDKHTIQTVTKLLLAQNVDLYGTHRQMKYALYQLGEENVCRLLEMRQAESLAKESQQLENARQMLRQIFKEQQCFSLKGLAINGTDLIETGIVNGKQIGKILHRLLELVIEEQLENKKEILLKYTREHLN